MLAELHDKAPEHSWRASKREIEAVFGKRVEDLFDSIDHKALASGSIAQVVFAPPVSLSVDAPLLPVACTGRYALDTVIQLTAARRVRDMV